MWSCVDGSHTFLMNKPSDISEDEVPASAYLRAVPNCTAGFVYTERGTSTKEWWYCCPFCKSNNIPSDQQVGNVFDTSSNVKSVHEWNMDFPVEVQSLANQYEHGQISLCGLFSSTERDASMTQYCHVQGEVNAITKLDRYVTVWTILTFYLHHACSIQSYYIIGNEYYTINNKIIICFWFTMSNSGGPAETRVNRRSWLTVLVETKWKCS